ncbi:MAG: MBL fold metallo-hydrolase [Deltaproteobacteria bacterium]|nr:MBL fold metallo-hydrolase [Deltaproteobacteria bacterium]MBW1738406.1 MBL fold metallo-hydrolase [Deltaproteobacteria bacterium]MBW1909945.1 MBL fold metallo-hydrolase [Deltaproteobacteria bacterium]MBW2033492.1 MBL fold metallo-hydrolase [Deltaproteobacteria bacterium]
MKNRDIHRRHFIAKLFELIKMAIILHLFPFPKFAKAANTSVKEKTVDSYHGLSIREIAIRKLHHGNGRFLNPFSKAEHGNPWRIISWKLFHENHFKSFYNQERKVSVSIDWEPVRRDRGLSITFIKHATVMIKDLDTHILVDPVFSCPFWFIKDFTPLAFDIEQMPNPHHVLITHGHYDHLDKPSLSRLNKDTHIISPLGYNEIFDELGMNQRTKLDWFETFTDGKRKITLLPCNHWTMRNPMTGPNRSLWGSFLIKTASGPSIFISGDTAYFPGFRELGKEFPIDLAIFNLGAYEPRWFMASSHINPAETVKAFRELQAKKLLIVHWGTFRLGDEPVHFPPIQIRRELKNEGLLDRLVHLNHGQTLFYNQRNSGG